MFLCHIYEMWCKITAILSITKKFVIIRHDFCTKSKYSDKIMIYVTKYTNR